MGSRAGGGKQIGGWGQCKGFDLVFALTIIPQTEPLMPRLVLLTEGFTGRSFVAAIYFVFMIVGALAYRVPPTGWKPAGWTPPASAAANPSSCCSHPGVGAAQLHMLL